jgi:hypothetical protein
MYNRFCQRKSFTEGSAAMNRYGHGKPRSFVKMLRASASLALALLVWGKAEAQPPTFAANAQHTANYSQAAQSLNTVHWTTAIDATASMRHGSTEKPGMGWRAAQVFTDFLGDCHGVTHGKLSPPRNTLGVCMRTMRRPPATARGRYPCDVTLSKGASIGKMHTFRLAGVRVVPAQLEDDLNNTGGYAHYGAPVITPANTIFVPVKTGATGGFEVNVFNASTGASLYTLSTDYTQPSHNWILPYQAVLATSSETRLYYPGNGGTVYYINNVDSVNHGAPVQQVFYTTLANYQANASAFNSTVFIDTPITADSSGNIFFGFCVSGTAPAPLNTTQSGFARIDPNGNATYVLAGTAAADSSIGRDTP